MTIVTMVTMMTLVAVMARSMVLVPTKQATEPTHGTSAAAAAVAAVVRASGPEQPSERSTVPVVTVVLGRRRRVVMSMAVVAVTGLLLALDLVLDRVGYSDAGCPAQQGLELASVAHLVPEDAAGTSADHGCHQALFAILGLAPLLPLAVLLLGWRGVARVGCVLLLLRRGVVRVLWLILAAMATVVFCCGHVDR